MLTSESSDIIRLKEFLAAKGVDFVSEIRASRTPPFDFALYVPGEGIANLAGQGRVSRRQMKLLQTSAKKECGLNIEWIVTPNEKANAVETALLELLATRFPGAVNAVFISSLKSQPVSVWLDRNPKNDSPPDLPALREVVEQLLKLYGVAAFLLMDGAGADTPTNPMILRRLKIVAPATTEQLAKALSAAGARIPEARWLQSKLDTLRKQGFVVRSTAGTYCITEFGLALVPHSPTRTSSDIERALALGRRKW
jgi:hypothetical protein